MAEKQSWVKWVALGCGGLILLAIVGVAGIFFVVKKATAGPEAVVQQFLAAAAAGDADRAYGTFSAPLKETQPLEDLRQAVSEHPALFSVVDTTFNNRSVDNAGAKLSGTAKLKAGTEVPVSFELVQENGVWKLASYHIGSGT